MRRCRGGSCFSLSWGHVSKVYGLIGGGVAVVAMLMVRWTSGSPYFFLSQLRHTELWMPVWLISLIWLGWYFVLGFSFGMLCGDGRNRTLARAVWFYRGSLYFIVGVFAGLMWYPLLFRVYLPFLSLPMLAVALACMIMAGVCWMRLGTWFSCVLFGYGLWLLIMLMTQVTLLLRH